jgi:hypothetical protein
MNFPYRKVRRLTNDEYDEVVARLSDRALGASRSIFQEQIKKYVPKSKLEKVVWENDQEEIINTVTINVKQIMGDALLEIENIRGVRNDST